MKALVTGAGGFIGGWLTSHLLDLGYEVRATDIKELGEWWQVDERAEIRDRTDLIRNDHQVRWLFRKFHGQVFMTDIDIVFHLASDMGGIGTITNRDLSANIIHNNTFIDCNIIRYAREAQVPKFFFSSSVCVYPTHLMDEPVYAALQESDVYPANPNESYGWQKLHTEHMLREFNKSHDWQVYIARFQNVYSSHCAWRGGREKAPAALCRKIAQAKIRGKPSIEVWGDGEQTRSFMHVSDCVRAVEELIHTDCHEPVTLGPSDIYTVNDFIDIACGIAGYEPRKLHDTSKPQGVRGRVFNHQKLMDVLGWVPDVGLEDGLLDLYPWIESQVREWLNEN